MSTNIADISARLTADTAQFTGAFNEAMRLTESFTGRLGGLEGVLSKGFTIAAIAKVSQAIFEATERAGKYAEELEQISTITGVATGTLQDWAVVLNRVGMGVQDVAGMTRILSRNIEEAKNGTQAAIDKFSNLGITINETSESEQVIRQIADSMSHMGSATERAAAATELLGRGGQRAINFLNQGSAAFDQASDSAARMGKLTEAQIALLAEMDDDLDDVGKSWEGLSNQIGAIFAPAVQAVAVAMKFWLNETTIFIQKVWLEFQELISGVDSFAKQIMNLASGVFSGDVFTGAGRQGIIERAKAIIEEENAVRDLIRADKDLVGTAEQYKTATEKKTQATKSASQALTEYRRAVELAIEIDRINSDERVRQMVERDKAFGNQAFFDAPFQPLTNQNVQTPTDRDMFERIRPNANFIGPMPGQAFNDPFGFNAQNQGGIGRSIVANTGNEVRAAEALQARVYEQITAQMNLAAQAGQELGEGMLRAAQDADTLRDAMDATRQAMPLSEMQELSEKSLRMGAINATWINQLGDIDAKQVVLGSTYDSTGDKLSAMQGRMIKLVSEGLDPASTEFKRMQEELKPLQDQTELTDAINGVFSSITSAFDTVVQGVLLGTQTMSQAINRLGVDIAASLGSGALKGILKGARDELSTSMSSMFASLKKGFGGIAQSLGLETSQLAGIGAAGLAVAGSVFAASRATEDRQNKMIMAGVGSAIGSYGGFLLGGPLGAVAGGAIGGQIGGMARRPDNFTKGLFGSESMLGSFMRGVPVMGDVLSSIFGWDDSAGRKRNEIDFIHGTQQAIKDLAAKAFTMQTPNEVMRLLSNADLPGEHGGSFGNIRTVFPTGTLFGGASASFQSYGQFKYLRSTLEGHVDGFQKMVSDAVNAMIRVFREANDKIVSQLVALAQQTATQAATSQEFMLKRTQLNQAIQAQIDSAHADMITMTDPTKLSAQVGKIQSLLQQRYNGEIQIVQAFIGKMQQAMAAWKGLTSTLDEQLAGLRLNRYGAPTPEAQFAFDQSRFTSALTSFRGSRTATAGAMVSDLASPLLSAAAAMAGGDMTSASYQSTWQTVVDALEEVRKTSVDETAKLNQDMLAALGEQTTIENLIAHNTARMADSLDNLRLEATGQFRAMGFNIPQFAEGTPSVPRTGLAVVHKGEEIIPVGGRSSRGLTVQVVNPTFVGTEQSMLRDFAAKLQPYINSNPSL